MHGAVGTGPKKSMPTENWAVLRECVNKDFVNSGSIGLIQGKHARHVIKGIFNNYFVRLCAVINIRCPQEVQRA